MKGGTGSAPARAISFSPKWLMVPRSFYSALVMGGLQLLKPGCAVPNIPLVLCSKYNYFIYSTSYKIKIQLTYNKIHHLKVYNSGGFDTL